MIFLEGFPLADGQGTKAALAIGKEVLQRLRQRPLVVLDRKEIVASPIQNTLGNLRLATDGVNLVAYGSNTYLA